MTSSSTFRVVPGAFAEAAVKSEQGALGSAQGSAPVPPGAAKRVAAVALVAVARKRAAAITAIVRCVRWGEMVGSLA
jgi:hypothetical protein